MKPGAVHLSLVFISELPTLPSSHLDLLCGVVPHIMVVRLIGSSPIGKREREGKYHLRVAGSAPIDDLLDYEHACQPLNRVTQDQS